MSGSCPFCKPGSSDEEVFGSSYARALVDARPITIGHALLVSADHVPSVFDLPPVQREGFRLVQAELVRRVLTAFGEVAAYEHGRSVACRFHASDQGHCHAHVHVLPVSDDLLKGLGWSTSEREPLDDVLTFGKRYLYQMVGSDSAEEWASAGHNVPRHFVRTELERVRSLMGRPYFPLTLHSIEHHRNVFATAATLRGARVSETRALLLRFQDEPPAGVLALIVEELGWNLLDLEVLLQYILVSGKGDSHVLPGVLDDLRAGYIRFLPARVGFPFATEMSREDEASGSRIVPLDPEQPGKSPSELLQIWSQVASVADWWIAREQTIVILPGKSELSLRIEGSVVEVNVISGGVPPLTQPGASGPGVRFVVNVSSLDARDGARLICEAVRIPYA